MSLRNIYDASMRVVPVIAAMEDRGVAVRHDRLKQLTKQYTVEAEECRLACVDLSGREIEDLPVNGRSKALDRVVFDVLGLQSSKTTDTGGPSMDKDVLAQWLIELENGSLEWQFIWNLQRYRKRKTGIGYNDSYEKYGLPIKEPGSLFGVLDDWLLLHPSCNPTGTDTLRGSMSNPNGQQISKQAIAEEVGPDGKMAKGHTARWMFGPAPGREWWVADAENIELRIPAYASGEKNLIELFENPDKPPFYGSNHMLNFSSIYPDVWQDTVRREGLTGAAAWCKEKSGIYTRCKGTWFCIQYGGGRRKADATAGREGAYDLLWSRLGNLAEYSRACIREARKFGYVTTLPDRSVDPLQGYPLLIRRTYDGDVEPTLPFNYKTQGSACWWKRQAMVKCHDQFARWRIEGEAAHRRSWDAGIALEIHDELIFDLPKKGDPVAEAAGKAPRGSSNLLRARQLKRIMESCGDDIGVPTPVKMSYNPDNWSEGIVIC